MLAKIASMIGMIEACNEDDSGSNGRIELEEFIAFFHCSIPVTFVTKDSTEVGSAVSVSVKVMN